MKTIKKMKELLIRSLYYRINDDSLRRLIDSIFGWLDKINDEYFDEKDKYLRIIAEQRSQINKLEKEVKRLTDKCDKISRRKEGFERFFDSKLQGW